MDEDYEPLKMKDAKAEDNSPVKICFKKPIAGKGGSDRGCSEDIEEFRKIRLCNTCSYEVKNKTELKEHLENVHFQKYSRGNLQKTTYILFQCNQCEDTYQSKELVQKHIL